MGRIGLSLLALTWIVAVAMGFHWILDYSNEPGSSMTGPEEWPAESRLNPSQNSHNLLMFLHPHCACSRASVGELDRLVVQSPVPLRIYLLFLQPKGYGEAWTKTDLWRKASLIPGVQLVLDPEGREAQLFSALTSGQTFLYGPDGHLRFSGGITAARGHAGDNAGLSALLSTLRGGENLRHTPVFGCKLNSHADGKI
jgi:hypothetical protein